MLHLSTTPAGPSGKRKGAGAPAGESAGAGADAGTDLSADDGGAADLAGDAALDAKGLALAMAKHVDYARRELGKLRGATASPSMLDHVRVEAYGEMQPLSALAQIALKNPTMLLVNPFDAALAPAIADAIRDADLNLNPIVEGNSLRVPVPKSSKETREATVKLISKIAEAAKTRVRRVRQAAMDKLKKASDTVSQDVVYREMKDVQAATNAASEEIAKLAEKKKLEVEAS